MQVNQPLYVCPINFWRVWVECMNDVNLPRTHLVYAQQNLGHDCEGPRSDAVWCSRLPTHDQYVDVERRHMGWTAASPRCALSLDRKQKLRHRLRCSSIRSPSAATFGPPLGSSEQRTAQSVPATNVGSRSVQTTRLFRGTWEMRRTGPPIREKQSKRND